ncbi:taste receptor type 2 member 8-like [Discoglossus pictus]
MVLVEVFAGIIISGFIVYVNILDWIKQKTLRSCDQILLALGLCNVLYPCLSGFLINMSILCPYITSAIFYQCFNVLSVSTILSSSWLTALLCLFYCLKIVNFRSGLLVQLKKKIDVMVPWLILAAALVSVFCSIPGIFSYSYQLSINDTTSITPNITTGFVIHKDSMQTLTPLLPNILIPLMIVTGTTVCIIWSLILHTRTMKQNLGEATGLEIHKRAAWTMLCLLLLYLIFYQSKVLIILRGLKSLSMEYFVMLMLVFAFSPVQSVVLIVGNRKLMQNYNKMLSHYMSCK